MAPVGIPLGSELNVKVDGNLEPDPPKSIMDYGKQTPAPPRRPPVRVLRKMTSWVFSFSYRFGWRR
jgi:hypothetical protein